MNKQALSLAIFIAGAYPAASSALGLGDIESNSHLNQPLRAKIDLLSAAPADASQIQVRLAPPDVFNRVGVARPDFLSNLRFTPTVQGGKPVILVSSDTPIQEPFVNFLLEVSWPQGQLLKEYTVMLDPPVLMQPGNTVAGEAAVRAEPKAAGNVRRPAPQAAQQQAAPQQPAAASRNRTYRVKPGDTLFRVASRLQRPGVSNDQMMMALFRANPGAFIGQNINNLRSGAVMKAPAGNEAGALSRAEARRQIRQQNAEWREFRKSLAGKTVPQQATGTKATGKPAPATAQAQTTAKTQDKARLEVLGTKTGDGAAKDAAVAAGNAKLAEIEKQLALASESLTARQNENTELKSRVTDLESMLSKKNRLLALRDSQLADLQKQLADNGIKVAPVSDMPDGQETGEPMGSQPVTGNVVKPDAATPDQGKDIQTHMANVTGQGNDAILRTGPPSQQPVPPTPQNVNTTPATPDTSAKPADSNVVTPLVADTRPIRPTGTVPLVPPAPSPVKPAIVPVTPAADAQKAGKAPSPVFADQAGEGNDLLGLLTSPLALKIGAGSLALLLLLWLLGRRRKPEGTDSTSTQSRFANLDDDDDVAVVDEEFNLDSLENELEKAESRGGKGYSTSQAAAKDDPFGTQRGDSGWDEDGLDASRSAGLLGGQTPEQGGEDDCLTEANVYIAYGLYQQAESELKKCIERNPDKLEYRHKLLECYFVANNREAFDNHAQQFVAANGVGKETLWKSVVEWGRKISPDNSLYQGDGSSIASAGSSSVAATVATALGGVAAATAAGVALASGGSGKVTAVDAASTHADIPVYQEDEFGDLDLGDLDFDDIDLDKLLQDSDGFDNEEKVVVPSVELPELPNLAVTPEHDQDVLVEPDDEPFELGDLDDDLDLDFDLDNTDDQVKPQQELAVNNVHRDADADNLLDFDLDDDSGEIPAVAAPLMAAAAEAASPTHLNLHLDNNTGINRILPKDTFYAPISDEDKDWLGDIDDALSFLDFPDEEIDLHEAHISTKLDLARAYLDMGDIEGARSTLEEVMVEGNDDQRREAEVLLHQTG